MRVADVWARTGPPWHGKYAEDHFHPNGRGYLAWAAAFLEALGVEDLGVEDLGVESG